MSCSPRCLRCGWSMIALTAPQRLKPARSRNLVALISLKPISTDTKSESVCDLLQSFPKLSCEVRIDLDVHMVCLFTLHNTATSRVFCPLLPTLIGPFRKMPVKDFVLLFLHVCAYQGANFPILAFCPHQPKAILLPPIGCCIVSNFLCMYYDRSWSSKSHCRSLPWFLMQLFQQ